MRLGGWWRLWIALSCAYAVLISAYVAISWPDTYDVPHDDTYVDRLPARAKLVLERSLSAPIGKAPAGEQWRESPIILSMPNGHEFTIAGDTPDTDSNLIGREYVRILNAELGSRRAEYVSNALAAWSIPVLSVLLVGLAARWVIVGFRFK